LEVLASLQQPNNPNDPHVEESFKILGYLAKMQRRLLQSHPSTDRRVQPERPIEFKYFPSLPAEIRILVWKFTAANIIMESKIVNLVVQDNKFITAFTRAQNLPLVCKESYTGYFQQYSCHNHDFIDLGGQSVPLAVNFAQDIFYITGDIEPLNPLLMAKFLPFHKVALQWPQHGYHDLLHGLPQLQELLVLSSHNSERYLSSAGEYQQVWSAHHCDEFPQQYTPCIEFWGDYRAQFAFGQRILGIYARRIWYR
jgi:hypothetical protein